MKETLDVIRAVSRRLEIRCSKTLLCVASVGCSVPDDTNTAKSTKIERVQRDKHCTNYRERVQKTAQINPLPRPLSGTLI